MELLIPHLLDSSITLRTTTHFEYFHLKNRPPNACLLTEDHTNVKFVSAHTKLTDLLCLSRCFPLTVRSEV